MGIYPGQYLLDLYGDIALLHISEVNDQAVSAAQVFLGAGQIYSISTEGLQSCELPFDIPVYTTSNTFPLKKKRWNPNK